MEIAIHETKERMGQAAADYAVQGLRTALEKRGEANLVLATGASQFEMLDALVSEPDVDWGSVTVFHLDEYVGLPDTHPASFCRYLRERFEEKLPAGPREFHYIDGTTDDPEEECRRLSELIRQHPTDVACIGIGENGHLAFNDPPADFETEEPFIVVELDEACRRQQVGEGWFDSLEDVPKKAITMSIQQIMSARRVSVTCPDARKADAVKDTVESRIRNTCPASILQKHPRCRLFLDQGAASKLSFQ